MCVLNSVCVFGRNKVHYGVFSRGRAEFSRGYKVGVWIILVVCKVVAGLVKERAS